MQCAPDASNTIDLALHMPRACLLAKDYLNHRFHAKRLAYLLHAANALHEHGLTSAAAQLCCANGDLRRPAVMCTLASGAVCVRLHACVPVDTFPAHKLAPDRNCLRSAAAPAQAAAPDKGSQPRNVGSGQSCGNSDTTSLLATPAYNGGILADLWFHRHCCALAELASKHASIAACAALLQCWVRGQTPAAQHVEPLVDAVCAALATAVTSGAAVRACVLPLDIATPWSACAMLLYFAT